MSFKDNYDVYHDRLVVARKGLPDFDIKDFPLEETVNYFDDLIHRISQFEVDIFEIMGLRNLSAFVGEVFAASYRHTTGGLFEKNPHQDGYPDLLLMDDHGLKLWSQLKHQMEEKGPFSPFLGGGVEVKATCGATLSAAVLRKKGLRKPQIGEHRLELLTKYDWKAHHRDTNNLLSILWDFIDGKPAIAAVFYSNELEEEDWGKIVQPRAGGGRTTSVSIMARSGIRKMYEGSLCIRKDPDYRPFLAGRNKGSRQLGLWD